MLSKYIKIYPNLQISSSWLNFKILNVSSVLKRFSFSFQIFHLALLDGRILKKAQLSAAYGRIRAFQWIPRSVCGRVCVCVFVCLCVCVFVCLWVESEKRI